MAFHLQRPSFDGSARPEHIGQIIQEFQYFVQSLWREVPRKFSHGFLYSSKISEQRNKTNTSLCEERIQRYTTQGASQDFLYIDCK